MSWMNRQVPDANEGLSPKQRRWPAILGVTAAAWVILSTLLLGILSFKSGQ